jgi:hypothetical protein
VTPAACASLYEPSLGRGLGGRCVQERAPQRGRLRRPDHRANPTRSYRTREPLRAVGEVLDSEPHAPDVIQEMRTHLEELKRLGIHAIKD